MRRPLLLFAVLVVCGGLLAALYLAYATERDYARLVAAGDRAAAAGRALDAVGAYSGAIALRPDAMLAAFKRGMTYRTMGELDAAVRDLIRAAALDPTATLPLEALGDIYAAQQRYDRAAERYAAYLALDDRSARVWYKLALARYRNSDPPGALAPLARALALEPALAEAHLLHGLALREMRRLTDARQALQLAIRHAPAFIPAREALAALYTDLGEPLRALDELEALAALDPETPDRLIALGFGHARARRFDAAVLALSRAIERFPTDGRVYAALGRVWLEAALVRNDDVSSKNALEALRAAVAFPDAPSDALTDYARLLMLHGDDSAAEGALRAATTRGPVAPDAYRHLAALAARRGRLDEARSALLDYAALVADVRPLGAVATQIAAHSLKLGDPATALAWIERAVEESGETADLTALRQQAASALAR